MVESTKRERGGKANWKMVLITQTTVDSQGLSDSKIFKLPLHAFPLDNVDPLTIP